MNDYEILDLEEEYINELSEEKIVNIDKNEYNSIIRNLIKKNKMLELENKKINMDLIDLNNKYIDIITDFDNLSCNYSQLEKDLYDMEIVNLELINIIKKD